MPKILKYYFCIATIVIITITIFLISQLNNNIIDEPIVESSESIENIESIESTETIENENFNIQEPIETISPFEESLELKIDDMFTKFIEMTEYQTIVSENDMLVDITFKDYGTVTFKMYTDTAPNAVEWFTSLGKNNVNTVYQESRKEKICFYFETTDRVFTRSERVDNIYPMKYCLYQPKNGCHTFYICTTDYIETTYDKEHLTEDTLNYLKTYGGNISAYQECIILGRAVYNTDILDLINDEFIIESIKIRKENNNEFLGFSETETTEPTTMEPKSTVEPTITTE